MAMYRKRPVVVEAHQFTKFFLRDAPKHFTEKVCFGNCRDKDHIHTLEGAMDLTPGDWLIRGVAGEFYPCKPDIFAATYEDAETTPKESE